MECNKVQEKLSALIDGILSQDEKMLVEEHLKSCEKCREVLSELKKTIGHIKNQEEIEPPPGLRRKARVKTRARAAPKKGLLEKLFYPLHIKLPLGAVATIAIAVTTIYIFKSIQPEIQLAKAPSEETREHKPQPPLIAGDEVTSSKGRYIRGEKQPEPAVPELKISKDKADSYLTKKEVLQAERDKAYVSGEGTSVAGKPSEQPMPAKEPESMKFAATKGPAPVMKEDKAIPSAGAVAKEDAKHEVRSPLRKTKTSPQTTKEIIPIFKKYSDLNKDFIYSASSGFGKSGKPYTELRQEVERYGENIYNPALDSTKNIICRDNDKELLSEYLKVLIATNNSADEFPCWILGDIYLCQPELLISIFKKLEKPEQKIIYDALRFGFENVTYNKENNIPNYYQLKKMLDSLNPKK